jgi:hypothetical protein
MTLQDLVPTASLELVQGVERQLLQRRRTGAIGGWIALAAALFQILSAAIKSDYLKNLGSFFKNLFTRRFDELLGPDGLSIYELTGMLILLIGFGIYFLFRRTSFLLKESEEAFRYTFWIDRFQAVEGTPGPRFVLANEDQLRLLHHD